MSYVDREYAYFRIEGPSPHEDLSSRLSLQPSETWNVGDPGPNGPRRCTHWRLDSGLAESSRLEQHVDALLQTLAPRAAILAELSQHHRLVLQCVGHYANWQHGFSLDHEQVRLAAGMGLRIAFDGFFVGDPRPDAPPSHDTTDR